jgi:hypothetical protein
MPGLGSESTQNTSSSSCQPRTNMCQNGQNQSCLAHSMHSRSVMPGLGSDITQSASRCLPYANMCKNG